MWCHKTTPALQASPPPEGNFGCAFYKNPNILFFCRMIQIKSATFVKSSPNLSQTPNNGLVEFAFIGRSNVGKSSLLNFLVNHKGLAKTSSKPGKTKLINHFLINSEFNFVDLPGYGYARSSKSERDKWGGASEQYLLQNENIKCLFVLLDFNVPPQQTDLEFLSWLQVHKIPFAIILTKTDKLNQSATYHHAKLFDETLAQVLGTQHKIFKVSAVKKRGREDILEFIGEMLGQTN